MHLIKHFPGLITIGYILIFFCIGSIGYAYYHEWLKLEIIEQHNRETNYLQEAINDFNMALSDFSLAGEGFLNWNEYDKINYCNKYKEIDSVLIQFNNIYTNEHIDSVRQLLAYKCDAVVSIANIIGSQRKVNDEIAKEIPQITQESKQTQPNKAKRKGFLGLFGKKEVPQATITTIKLQNLYRNAISQSTKNRNQLYVLTDSLVKRNHQLNLQLNTIMRQLDKTARMNIRYREDNISVMREQSYQQIGGLTLLLIILLVLSYIIILRDVRQRERSKNKLEESIRQNHQLLDMRKKIILTVSHDIRGPLNIIGGSAALALDTSDKEKRDNYLKNINTICIHVIHLLNNLLDVYRLNEAKEKPNNIPFKLEDLMHRISTGTGHIIKNKGLLFTSEFVNTNVVVLGDEDRIEQITDNLLSNAVKFTHFGKVELYAEYCNGKLKIVVRDTGIGMSEDTIQRIYQPFERADNIENIDGFGLGLTITKGLVALLGGTIQVLSKEGVGTEFCVILPLPLTDTPINITPVKSSSNQNLPHSVLVIDDDPLQLEIIKEMLERNMITCVVCTNVSDVVKEMRTRNYDMLLSDLQMPGTDGFALLKLLRHSNIGNSQYIPVLAMTARGDYESNTLVEQGFAGSIFKPFSMQELLESISATISGMTKHVTLDFSMLFSGDNDKMLILKNLVTSCNKDLYELKHVLDSRDKKTLQEILHRIYPVWELLNIHDEIKNVRQDFGNPKASWETLSNHIKRIIEITSDIRFNAQREIIFLTNEAKDINS